MEGAVVRIVFVGMLFGFLHFASAEQLTGRIFSAGKMSDGPVYIQKADIENQPDGTTSAKGDILDSDGKTIISEHAVYSGATFISQQIENFKEHKEYRATLHDRRVQFETYDISESGEKKLSSSRKEVVNGNFVTGAIAENFIHENWDKLMQGKRIDIRFAVFEREETIGFFLKKKNEAEVDGKSAVVIVMRPSSLFVSMVVAPIEISVDKISRHIIHYKGRTPVKTSDDKNFIADVVYDRTTPSISRSTAHAPAHAKR